MDIYAFADQKGGVGKTTVTVGVGAALARSGRRVLLIELDPQASATKVLDIETDEQCTMADAMLEPGRFRLTQTIVETGWRFDLAPSRAHARRLHVAASTCSAWRCARRRGPVDR